MKIETTQIHNNYSTIARGFFSKLYNTTCLLSPTTIVFVKKLLAKIERFAGNIIFFVKNLKTMLVQFAFALYKIYLQK
jgi:hypothetical protein